MTWSSPPEADWEHVQRSTLLVLPLVLARLRTPAMAAGVSDHPWSLEELVGLLEEQEAIAVRDARAAKAN